MSTALGIASVTHVLKDLLNDGLAANDVASVIGASVTVSSKSPAQVEAQSGNPGAQLNIFLYQVSHNTGWSNIGYPSRNERGELTGNPPLALDLHYLLSAFGENDLHAEILLGYGMQILHEHPILERSVINASLASETIADSGLAGQIEQVKVTPEPISTEEISKLWTAFQAKYRPCTAYLATVVLIESSRPVRTVLLAEEPKLYVLPFRRPVIEQVLSQAILGDRDSPILENQRILAGYGLIVKGKRMKASRLMVQVSDKEIIPENRAVSDTQISVLLPDTLKAGVQGVQVIHQIEMGSPGDYRKAAESNLAAFVLSPDIREVHTRTTGIELILRPPLHQKQKVVLLLNELLPPGADPGLVPRSYSFTLPASVLSALDEGETVDTVTFPVSGISAGEYLARVQVDGAESPLWANDGEEYRTITIT